MCIYCLSEGVLPSFQQQQWKQQHERSPETKAEFFQSHVLAAVGQSHIESERKEGTFQSGSVAFANKLVPLI